MEAKYDLLFYLSKNDGFDGFSLRVASADANGAARAEELAASLKVYLAKDVTIRTEVRPSRFSPRDPQSSSKVQKIV